MIISEILKNLHSSSIEDNLRVINLSTYVTDLPIGESETAIHSGFTFALNTGKKFELLIDIGTNKIIRQPVLAECKLPIYFGVMYLRRGWYYNSVIFSCISGVDENGENVEMESIDTKKEFYDFLESYRIAEVFKYDEQDERIVVSKYRSKVDLTTVLFFYDNNFSVYERINRARSSRYLARETDGEDYDEGERQSFGRYAGTYAQDVEGLSDNFINDVLDGEPDAYWNID